MLLYRHHVAVSLHQTTGIATGQVLLTVQLYILQVTTDREERCVSNSGYILQGRALGYVTCFHPSRSDAPQPPCPRQRSCYEGEAD
ncbi:hypothetical protein C0Q70_11209 [Pomacea canaliculata]|uniref:Uncharacterized protein n=1 Tax=Pomacea canaliculata TaxID=400727 RepID=A0A2T7P5D4_POMCA|nr:hypothetical protein C0Q70_11209 [Pomacea canaliculata]